MKLPSQKRIYLSAINEALTIFHNDSKFIFRGAPPYLAELSGASHPLLLRLAARKACAALSSARSTSCSFMAFFKSASVGCQCLIKFLGDTDVVNDKPELFIGIMVVLLNGCAREAEEPCIRDNSYQSLLIYVKSHP